MYGEVPDPVIGPGSVAIRVQAISIEGGDLYHRRFTPPASSIHVGGYLAAGIVEAVGSKVTTAAAGDRVVAFNWHGSHAELMVAPAEMTYPVPTGLDLRRAVTVPIAFGTAGNALFEHARLKAGETVLVQGAAGGVGLAAVQLAARAGARVIGTASSATRLERLKAYGLSYGIDYVRDDIADRIGEITRGQGVDVVIDLAGGNATGGLIRSLKFGGRMAIVGAASGEKTSFGFAEIVIGGLTLHGVLFGRTMATAQARVDIAGMMALVSSGDFSMPIAATFPLEEAASAHAAAEMGHPFGRVIIEV